MPSQYKRRSGGKSLEPPAKRLKMSDSERSSLSDSEPNQSDTSDATAQTAGNIKLYLVQAKLDAQAISELYSLAERHNLRVSKPQKTASESAEPQYKLQLCHTAEESDIIITDVRMRKRLERHIDWNLAKDRAVVTTDWLRESVKNQTVLPCGDYYALRELRSTTTENCPDADDDSAECQDTGDGLSESATESKQPPQVAVTKAHYTNRYACLRCSPLTCPNQGLLHQLGIIYRSRELEGKQTTYPHAITTSRLAEVSSLPYIGEKTLSKITEYVNRGKIAESQSIESSSRFQALSTFSTIYGIGPTTARKLHYYETQPSSIIRDDHERKMVTAAPALSIRDAITLKDDLDQKIPRAEVDLMHEIVMGELDKLHAGCFSTVVGGYRRGKSESNDVDIVITHPKLASGSDQIKALGEKLVNRLYECGLVTHVMHLSGFHPPDALRTSHWDSLEKALTVFILPPGKSGSKRVHRRLDLIFAAPEAYWTAVTGWTGSKMFERDLRLWAKVEKGMKFDSSGMIRRRDSHPYFPRSEQDVFDILGLEWIDPTMRNADI
ncbi:hypothetical protein C8J57DRAFT_1283139 [Mycena rebaudengoi]|nr:hypothetical protein C8J57DRAFT_1283139 [Mycena rebaudengoi]